ncbi:MAG: glycerol-3-phosphate 1-O-acyltransferase PlsY [Akkermansiaceae bacterium]|nr:glycerol-3-phosphate 1-O-acyltransferase PlsY [Akkermansiaceae bacterium]
MRPLLTLLFCLLPCLSWAQESKPRVRLETSHGDIVIELNPEKAPLSSENFLNYVEKGFYDGTVFHRVISNFMIQGGGFALVDGVPTKKPTDEPIRNESQNGLSNRRGTVAMARTNDLHSATAQFFINVKDNDNLNYPSHGGYAVFGEVVEGMEVVDKIRNVRTGVGSLGMPGPDGNIQTRRARDVPLEPVVIESAKVVEPAAETPDPPTEPAGTSSSGKGAAPATPAQPPAEDASPGRAASGQREHGSTSEIHPWSEPRSYLLLALSFLLGSIPFGLIIAKSQGVNIREQGSGNIGATNVWRILGKKFGIPCLILDLLKGLIPVLLAISLIRIADRSPLLAIPLPESWSLIADTSQAIHVQIIHVLTALLAVLGHNYSPWVGFKGGKGIATSAGVLLGLMPIGLLILLVLWLVLFAATRYVSVASIGASLSLPLVTLYGSWHHGRLQDGTWNKPLFAFALVIAVLATWKHRSNIKRLIDGTEGGFKRKRD